MKYGDRHPEFFSGLSFVEKAAIAVEDYTLAARHKLEAELYQNAAPDPKCPTGYCYFIDVGGLGSGLCLIKGAK